ncbi:MAG: formimidoylglutamase [Saprospiraceae bacterium]
MHKATLSTVWTGRATPEANAYWYQRVTCLSVDDPLPILTKDEIGIVLIGYAVDEGVRLNKGRTGAAEGPAAIRAQLTKQPDHLPEGIRIIDMGDVVHSTDKLFDTMMTLSNVVEEAQSGGYITIVLGGGHDVAAGHYLGLHRSQKTKTEDFKLGAINFDAHLDLRPLGEEGPNSGTPFSLIAMLNEQFKQPFKYCCVGVQAQGNTRDLLNRATELGTQMVMLDDADRASETLKGFGESCDALYVTVDLDGFPSYVSPGVSAPGIDGLSYPRIKQQLIELVQTKKVLGFDVAECSPGFDIDNRTAKLGARLIVDVVSAVAPAMRGSKDKTY